MKTCLRFYFSHSVLGACLFGQFRAIAIVLCTALASLSSVTYTVDVQADTLSRNTPFLRVRVGTNGGSPATVEYNPGIPPLFTALGGGASEAEHTSTNNIAGGSGTYTVRIITDVNLKAPITDPSLSATFNYNSSSPMACTTPATCGTSSIPMTQIAWDARDNDTLNTVFQYDGSANQLFQTQTDVNPANNGTNNRHRNFYRFRYINNVLYPAGTYEGTVIYSGSGG